jgi:hypothetical protein
MKDQKKIHLVSLYQSIYFHFALINSFLSLQALPLKIVHTKFYFLLKYGQNLMI